jgi:uncharacterized membrane protein YkoI
MHWEETMSKWVSWLCVVAIAGLLGAAARADEEKVPVDKIPKAVVDAVKAKFPGAELKGCEKEKDGDKVTYDVEIKHKDQNYEVAVTPEGVITGYEKQIDAKDLPKQVTKTLDEKYPKATIKMAEEVYVIKDKKETMVHYEIAVVDTDKKQHEVLIAPDGKIVQPAAKPAPAAEKIETDKLPKAIMDAIKGRFPDADITSAEKEKEGDKVVFDIELKSKGKKYEMDIEENGTILQVEKEVAAKDLPEGVTKAIEAKYPKSKIKEIMEVNKVKDKKETPDHYEVVIETADKKEKELEVSLDGKTIMEEGGESKEPKKEEGKK